VSFEGCRVEAAPSRKKIYNSVGRSKRNHG